MPQLRALCQKVILYSRGGEESKIFRVGAVKSYKSEVRVTLIFKQAAR
jgi:hypothetical protein